MSPNLFLLGIIWFTLVAISILDIKLNGSSDSVNNRPVIGILTIPEYTQGTSCLNITNFKN